LFGGNGRGTNTDFSTTGNTTLAEGLYYFRNFTVNTGHTVTINGFARIYCSGTFTVQSGATITVGIATRNTSSAPGYSGADLRYFGGEGTWGPSFAYSPHLFPAGGAGGSGFSRVVNGTINNIALGGNGGGSIWIEANDAISVNGTITAIGGNGTAISSGSGGYLSGGGGGGSGGAIMLTSLASITIASAATLSVRGGDGGNGVLNIGNSRGYGGSGGGGGWVWLTAPTVTTTGSTITLSGGSAGVTASNGTVGATEGSGYGGSFGGLGGYTASDGASGQSGILVTRTYKAVA
jgi:hypothetical protein